MRRDTVKIEGDLFGIVDRLKSIDSGYFVVYDKSRHVFEVHNSRQRGNTYALTVPYPCLDVRTVLLVQRTRAENAQKLLAEMERENRKAEYRQNRDAVEKAMTTAKV